MAQKRMFGARIDEEWISQFEAIAAQRGVRPSEIAREAFAQYLGLEAGGDRTSDPARLERLEAAIAALTKRLEALERSELAIASREAPTSGGQNLEPDSASAASTPSDWMTTREAWEQLGRPGSWNSFRQAGPEKLEALGLEVAPGRKQRGGGGRWLRITTKC